ncbi:MAG: DNA repair protein RadA [Clostridiales bacterium]|jgi:DNA repair protein RadA/Sms|nr:DNA repair protein RadA [Clostridiales bacterium]
MARQKTIYVCQECGYSTSGWLGKCPSCNSWGSFSEEASDAAGQKQPVGAGGRSNAAAVGVKALRLREIDASGGEDRFQTGIGEFDRVLGGGLVKGSLVLVGGDPGIGKSTLLLQMCATIRLDETPDAASLPKAPAGAATPQKKAAPPPKAPSPRQSAPASTILYVSGEESARQLKMRAARLGVSGETLLVAAENRLSGILSLIDDYVPKVVIVDSIQTMYNEELNTTPGSVGQIRDVTMSLMRVAKASGVSFFIVGHVTKEGAIAGPKVLEHMVDTVLYFEGERSAGLRILRAAKNRFGSTNEIGIFDMADGGLVEVENPSAVMLSERPRGVSGSVVVPSIEGTRPMLVEIQALASRTGAQNPRRMATGVDFNRMTLMVAILEKRLGLKLFDCDVYVNVTGGLRLYEPACDLGIIAAVASSFRDKAFDPDTAMIGEVGLTGEIRSVDQIEKRLNEARRLGFLRCIVPEGNVSGGGRLRSRALETGGLELIPARHIVKVFDLWI